MFSFLALTLEGAGLTEPTVWRISSATYAVYLIPSLFLRGRQIRKASSADPSIQPGAFRLRYLAGGAFALLQVHNVLALHAGWPFVIAVLGELATSFVMFSRIFREIWEQPAV